MASKSAQDTSVTPEAIEELLDTIDKNLERLKTLYEQYFLGIQKQPPTFLHNDLDRKLRDLMQLQIRNTGLRYRLATLQQKMGAYNSYWKRTLRQIENGTYLRNLSKIGREAVRTGAEIPEEILAAMPKRMREQVIRDREQALAIARRRKLEATGELSDEDLLTLAPEEPPPADDDVAAVIAEPSELRRELKTRGGAHVIDEADAELDIDSFFAAVVKEDEPEPAAPAPARAPTPAPARAPTPAPAPAQARAPTPAPAARASSPVIHAPSQVTRPNPIAPGAAARSGPVAVEQIATPGTTGKLPDAPPAVTAALPKVPAPATGALPKIPRPPPVPPIPREATQKMPAVMRPPSVPRPPTPSPAPAAPRPPAARAPTSPGSRPPPPGMTDADVNALYSKYVQAKQMLGEQVGPEGRAKLLKTIHAQAPKIMEQYKAKAVDFSVVVKDNQVVIRAKPKL